MKKYTGITQDPFFSSIDDVRSVDETFEELFNFLHEAGDTPTLDQIIDGLQIVE